MSAFWAVCKRCGERYFHCFVGRTLVSGHDCKFAGQPYEDQPFAGDPTNAPAKSGERD